MFQPARKPERADELLQALARRIRTLREQQGLTQEDFAVRCGISVSFASLLERGERSPSYETLVDISDALEVSLSDLFRDSPQDAYDDPYFGRLLDLARRLRLSRAQVDRLIGVGQVMFEKGEQEQNRGMLRPLNASLMCTSDSCRRPVLAKGLCASHYHRARRARL